jgi:glutamine synthetase
MRGKLQHVTFDQTMIDEDIFEEGTMFDGSSIAGWKAINESDMVLMPDPDSAYMDPFFGASTLAINCDMLDPLTYQPYNRDPRTTAKKAEAYVKSTGLGDSVYFGPEPEFFIFDDVRYSNTTYKVGFSVDHSELPTNNDTEYESGNNGHHIGLKKGYFPVPPLDTAQDMRGEMLAAMGAMGVPIEKHHHEVASAQHELGIKFCPIIKAADSVQIYKYVIQQVAQAYGKTVTFMPKPVYGDNGSGMHCHQSIWKDGKPLFAGDQYAGLSMDALYYIGGIIKHAKAVNAFTNPTTNSYKRLVPGFEAPVLLAYSARNRSASCRIPLRPVAEGQARRSPLPRSAGQPVSRLCRDADGRPRRHQEQDPPGRADGQGSVRAAAGRAEDDPDRLRLAPRSAREPRQGPRVPARPAACSTTTRSTATSSSR